MSQEKDTIEKMKKELDKVIIDSGAQVKKYSKEELVERMELAKEIADKVFGPGVTQSIIITLFSALKDFKAK